MKRTKETEVLNGTEILKDNYHFTSIESINENLKTVRKEYNVHYSFEKFKKEVTLIENLNHFTDLVPLFLKSSLEKKQSDNISKNWIISLFEETNSTMELNKLAERISEFNLSTKKGVRCENDVTELKSNISTALSNFKKYLNPETVNKIKFLMNSIPELTFGLVHGDLRNENIIFNLKGTKFIDFEFSHIGFCIYDIANLIWSESISLDEVECFTKAYSKSNPLSSLDIKLLPITTVLCGLLELQRFFVNGRKWTDPGSPRTNERTLIERISYFENRLLS
jgi:thiamine kinase-like enzyme